MAAKAATEASKGAEDGGSCNFDAPALRVPNRKVAKATEIIEQAGFTCFEWKLFKKTKVLVLNLGFMGQGFQRTKGAEAASKKLEELGYETCMYYQVD